MKSPTRIASIHAREVFDSRGWPTLEAEVMTESGLIGRAMVPSGASTGKSEALELRDGDPRRFAGRGVRKAVANVNDQIAPLLVGKDSADQTVLDEAMIVLDGTPNKSRLGANAILSVSCAMARAAALGKGVPLHRHLSEIEAIGKIKLSLPLPMINILSGGLHAGGALDFQDFLVLCAGAENLNQCLEWTSAIWWKTREILARRGFAHLGVADEGGFGAPLPSNEAALEILNSVVQGAGLKPGRDIFYALDVASSHFYDSSKDSYFLRAEKRSLSADELTNYLTRLADQYPIISIEDPLHEEAWDDWKKITARVGTRTQLIGDDLFTTNPMRLEKGLRNGSANSVLIKINQVGTLTEARRVLNRAQQAGMTTVLSARSGETEDPFMSDLAVGWNAGQIKIGSFSRSSRLAKYNELIRLAEELEKSGEERWVGSFALQKWIKR